MSDIDGVDYAFPPHPDPVRLYDQGYRFALRYVGPGSAPKHLTAGEVTRLHGAGLDIGLLVEGGINDVLAGRQVGRTHAATARYHAESLGAPADVVYWFAADIDITPDNIDDAVEYFRGVNDVLHGTQIGVYGDTEICRRLHAALYASSFFKPAASAWSHGDFPYDIIQVRNGINFAGTGAKIDWCRAPAPIRGLWTAPNRNEAPMRFIFSEAIGGDGKRVYITDGVTYRVVPISSIVNDLHTQAFAPPIVFVTTKPTLWTIDQMISAVCGHPYKAPADGAGGGGHSGPLTVTGTFTSTATPTEGS